MTLEVRGFCEVIAEHFVSEEKATEKIRSVEVTLPPTRVCRTSSLCGFTFRHFRVSVQNGKNQIVVIEAKAVDYLCVYLNFFSLFL